MKKIFFLIFIISSAIISCKKDFPIPKQPAEISPNALLIAALSATASNNVINYLGLTRWMGYWARDPMFPPDLQTETYAIKNDYTDKEWSRIYSALTLYDDLEKSGRANHSPFYIGVAKLMKAYHFSTLVDLYNDVPYKDAFTTNQPVYDSAQSIYDDLVAQLDSAFFYFENARAYYGSHAVDVAYNDYLSDIVFGASGGGSFSYNDRLTRWEKFTNTLELKLLMHQSQIANRNDYINKQMNIITSGARKSAGFIGAGESAIVEPRYSNSTGTGFLLYDYLIANTVTDTSGQLQPLLYYYTANPYAEIFYHRSDDDIRGDFYFYRNRYNEFRNQTKYLNIGDSIILYDGDLSQILTFINDGSFIIYKAYSVSTSTFLACDTFPFSYSGGPNYDGDPTPMYLGIFAEILVKDTAGGIPCFKKNILIFSDFESLFLQDEAAQRGYINVNAQMLYESAISQNFICLLNNIGIPANGALREALIYFSQNVPDIGWAASPNKLEAIMTQKWAAMNGVNWVEAYNDYRRTGYPTSNVLGISHAPTHVRPQIPTRFLYPQSQLNTNSAHVPPLPDGQYSRVFWDQ